MMNDDKKPEDDLEEDLDVEFESLEESESPQKVIKELKKRIKEVQKEKSDIFTSLQKTKADFINLRKRDEEEKSTKAKYASLESIEKFIPILDSIDQAILHLDDKNSQWGKGILSIKAQLIEAFASLGAKQYNPLGEIFDPNKHEAVGVKKVKKEEEDGIVTSVFQTGYILNDKTIKAPKVEVGQYEK